MAQTYILVCCEEKYTVRIQNEGNNTGHGSVHRLGEISCDWCETCNTVKYSKN